MALKFHLLRPDDLLALTIEGINLKVVSQRRTHQEALTALDPAQPAYLVVNFAPQTVAEQAVFESSPTNPPPPPAGQTDPYNNPGVPSAPVLPAQARLGGPSRLVFRLPDEQGFSIPLTTAGLLEWSELELVVSPLAGIPENPTPAQRASAPAIKAPEALETAIELPYRLIISPNTEVGWQHAALPKTHAGRTELWHTRLALKGKKGGLQELSRQRPAPLRAIWSPDFNPQKFKANQQPLFGKPDLDWGVLTPMTPSDRHEIVVLTSAFHGYIRDYQDYNTYEPRPFYAEQLILTSLGGWLKSRGNWDPPVPFRLRLPRRFDAQVNWSKFVSQFTSVIPKAGGPLDPRSRAFRPGNPR